MRRNATRLIVAVVLGVGGFAAAAYASGNSPLALLDTPTDTTGTTATTDTTGTTATTGTTGTTATTGTTGTTETTGTTATTGTTGTTGTTETTPQKVTICHHTHSKKHPFHTISVSVNALPAHLRHGDTVAPCPSVAAQQAQAKAKANAKAKGNAKAKAKSKS